MTWQTLFWVVFWWTAASFPVGVATGRMLRRAADQQTREL